jgi:branched-chain amino acid aminotransferase
VKIDQYIYQGVSMTFPMLEKPLGDYCYLNGVKTFYSSSEGKDLLKPSDDVIYYESIRFQKKVMLFFEEHMVRLHRSVEAKENFAVDSNLIYDLASKLINEAVPEITDGNLRVVVTSQNILIHLSDVFYPTKDMYLQGIVTSTLAWDRFEPQVKVFRGDFKKAVADTFEKESCFGLPYEVLLVDSNGKIYEGSRSNFFVMHDKTIYSPPASQILIGITRKYVMISLEKAGFEYSEKSFSLEEIVALREQSVVDKLAFAVFVTSSPFDILPIRSIDKEEFGSANCPNLQTLLKEYQSIVNYYIHSRQSDTEENT